MPTIHLTTFVAAPAERVFDLCRSIDLHRKSMAHTNEEAIAGTVSGDDFVMTSYGTTSPVVDGCSFTWNAIIDGDLSGNSIEGTVTYQRSPNDDPDCADLACANVQDFSGSRPPK